MSVAFKDLPYYKELRMTHKHMKYRCLNVKSPKYKNYGGRGINICDEWLSFKNFYDDMVGTYSIGLTLDRIDNNGDYTKENCRWATLLQQARNKSNSRIIHFENKDKTLSEWAEITGIKRSTLSMRVNRYGWAISKALTTGRTL